MDADKIKTTRQTGDGNVTKEAGGDETRHHRHDGGIIEQTNHADETIEQTKVGGTERSATGHGFVAAEEVAINEIGTSENNARLASISSSVSDSGWSCDFSHD